LKGLPNQTKLFEPSHARGLGKTWVGLDQREKRKDFLCSSYSGGGFFVVITVWQWQTHLDIVKFRQPTKPGGCRL